MRDLLFFVYLWLYLKKANINSPWQGLRPFVYVKWCVFSKQQLILTQFNLPGNLKGVAGFKNQTELYQHSCLRKKFNLINLHFSSFFQLKCQTTYNLFRIVVFVLTTRRAPVNCISWLFQWLSSFVSFRRFHDNFGRK